MNLQTIAEHTVDMDLLSPYSNILDCGCFGFEFTQYFRNLGHNVKAIDVQCLEGDYQMIALSDFNGTAYIKMSNDKQAIGIQREKTNYEIRATTLSNLSKYYGVMLWDLIKLDIESSEYEVIMSMDRPYATQISVEFHTHCGQTNKQVQDMLDRLYALGYKTIQHEKTARHGLKPNFWDSLFVLQ